MDKPIIVAACRILGIALVVADLDRSIAFYRDGLGFRLESIPHGGGSSRVEATLSLSGVLLQLRQAGPHAAPYPTKRAANDPWFQHFAIRVTDMDAAYAILSSQPISAISIGEPQQLPPSSGSMIAFKFRDPDGHPLELSYYPNEAEAVCAGPFIAVDHSAIAVSDLDVSIDFYVNRLGFSLAEQLVNQGPTQWRLDGLDGAVVDIVVLKPSGGGPHLELLHYRSPISTKFVTAFDQNDIAATRLVISTDSENHRLIADPDGHLIDLAVATDEVIWSTR